MLECYLERKCHAEKAQQHATKCKNISYKFATSNKINDTFTTHTVRCKIKKTSTRSRPAVLTTGSVVSTKRPVVSTKRRPDLSTKRPALSTKRPTVPTKEPTVPTKKNNQLVSPLQHTSTANEVERATSNPLKYVVSLTYFSRKINFR